MDLTDSECVEGCRSGNPENFRLLVHRYQRPLFSLLVGRLRDRSQAEEAVQESFVRAFQSLRKLRKPESFYSWLLGIAGLVAKEHFRSLKRHNKDRELSSETAFTEPADSNAEHLLDEAIAVLPETCRKAILLRYYDGLSCQDISVRLEMPIGTVTKTLSRAYALLRQELQARESADIAAIHTE